MSVRPYRARTWSSPSFFPHRELNLTGRHGEVSASRIRQKWTESLSEVSSCYLCGQYFYLAKTYFLQSDNLGRQRKFFFQSSLSVAFQISTNPHCELVRCNPGESCSQTSRGEDWEDAFEGFFVFTKMRFSSTYDHRAPRLYCQLPGSVMVVSEEAIGVLPAKDQSSS